MPEGGAVVKGGYTRRLLFDKQRRWTGGGVSGDNSAFPLLYQTGYWVTLPQAVESVRDKRL